MDECYNDDGTFKDVNYENVEQRKREREMYLLNVRIYHECS